MLFETRDHEYRRLLPLVLEGFAGGEKAYHLVNPVLRDDHLRRLDEAGIDVGTTRGRGQLDVRGWDEICSPGGRFDQEAMIGLMESVLVEGRTQGFPRTRLIGFENPLFEGIVGGVGPEDVIEYESRLNRIFARFDDPVVCAYDRTRLGTGQALDLLCAHPATFTDGVLGVNPAYVPSRRFVAERRGGNHLAVLRERYLAAILEEREQDAVEVVVEEGLWLDIPVYRLHQGVVQAAQQEIGRLWQARRVGMAEVHLATEAARRALAHLQPYLPAEPKNGMRVIVACVEGEAHDLGARMLGDLLEAGGFEVSFLGADVSADGLVELVRRRSPRAVALSATTAAAAPTLLRTVAKLREAAGDDLAIAAGGQVFRSVPHLRAKLAVDVQAPTAEDGLRALRRFLSR
jgi:methanogenic corrinoid protein MtbC1